MKWQFSEEIWEKISALWAKPEEKEPEDVKYSDPQVREYLKIMFRVRQTSKSGMEQEYNVREAWKKVDRQTSSLARRKLVRRMMKYAALFVFLLGTAIYFAEYRAMRSVPVAGLVEDTIVPGVYRAELILANGERIELNEYTETQEIKEMGIKLVGDNVAGKLQYEIAGAEETGSDAYNTLNVPKGGEYTLILPDGSQVWLNSETTLRFPARFAGDKREVFLEGEAYFKIRHNPEVPFHVYADEKDITVLGTSFNVSAYPDDRHWETTLVSGKVSITWQEGQVLMKPSEQYVVDRTTGKGRLEKVDPELYTSWVDGKFYFRAFTFEEIVKKLERWYDFTMTYGDETIRKMRFSGTINKHCPIEETLRYLEKTTDIRFHIEGKNITVSKI